MKNNLCNIVKFEYKIPSSGNQWKDIFIDVDDAPVKGNHFIAAVTSVENYDISHDGNLSQGGRVVVHVREKGSKTYSEYRGYALKNVTYHAKLVQADCEEENG